MRIHAWPGKNINTIDSETTNYSTMQILIPGSKKIIFTNFGKSN